MKTLLYAVTLFLALLGGVSPVAAADPMPMPAVGIAAATPTPPATVLVVVDVLNLRAGPGTNHPILARLARTTRLEVNGRSPNGAWLAVQAGSRSGWVAARCVRPLSAINVPAQVVATTPVPIPAPASAPQRLDTVVLGPDTPWPVRANHVIGWGYEFVDASQSYDWMLNRDVYGQVAHEFWGSRLYDRHPHGIRLTLIDPIWEEGCPSPVAPVPLVAGSRCLLEGFGDGEGAMVYAGCAVASDHFYSPQECFVTITVGGPHVTDAVVAATITAQNMLVAGYAARTPDFSRLPFTPALGEAYREGDQWRWRDPYLQIAPPQ